MSPEEHSVKMLRSNSQQQGLQLMQHCVVKENWHKLAQTLEPIFGTKPPSDLCQFKVAMSCNSHVVSVVNSVQRQRATNGTTADQSTTSKWSEVDCNNMFINCLLRHKVCYSTELLCCDCYHAPTMHALLSL